MKERYDLLQSLHLATGVAISISNAASDISLCHPDVPLPGLLNTMIKRFSEEHCDSEHPLLVDENSLYFVALAQFSDNGYVMLGPASPVAYDEMFLRHYLADTTYISDIEHILELLLHGANCSIQSITYTVRLAVKILSDKLIATQNIRIFSENALRSNIHSKLIKNQYETAEQRLFHTPKKYEDILFEAVSEGNPEIFKRYQTSPVPGTLGRLSLNPDHQQRYTFVSVITLICRAAMQGGLDTETAFAICDTFCQQMDSLAPPADIWHLFISAVDTYIHKVQEAKLQQNTLSPQIAECCSYIKKNIQSDLSLTKIAEHCRLSSSYLSRRFFFFFGVSLTDYISQMKLERACHLLRYTTFPISEISNILQYCSQSYFTEQFKKRYHMTPKKFRDSGKIF